MKKLLTILILLLAVVVTVKATETVTDIYPNHNIGEWNSLNIKNSKISGLQENDIITVSITNVGSNAQYLFQASNTNIDGVDNISGNLQTSDTQFTLTVTSDLIAALSEKELTINGKEFTITKVTVKSGNTTTTLYGDPEELYNWDSASAISIVKTPFANAMIGDVITANFSIETPEVHFQDGSNWQTFINGQVNLDNNQETASFTITDDKVYSENTKSALDLIKESGIRIRGKYYTVSKVTIKASTDGSETDLYTTETAIGNWKNNDVYIEASHFSGTNADAVITVYIKQYSTLHQAQFKNGDGWGAFKDDNNVEIGGTTFSSDNTSASLTINESILNALKANNLIIQGQNCKLTSATLTHYDYKVSVVAENSTIKVVGDDESETDFINETEYPKGSTIKLKAYPVNDNYEFQKWSDGSTESSEQLYTISSIAEDISLTATSIETAPITYPITVWEKTDDNGIAISWDNDSWAGIQVQTSDSEYSSWQSKLSNVVENDVIKLYVNPAEGDKSYDVRYWDNGNWNSLSSLSPNNNIISIPLTSVLANAVKTSGLFITGIRYYLTKVTVEKPKYQLTIVSNGGSVTVKKGEETDPTADREFEAGTALTLTATPASSIYTFSKWQKNGADIVGGTNPLNTTMDGADMTITAVFTTSVDPQDLGAESTEIKASPEQGIVIPCWRFKNASVGAQALHPLPMS